MPAPPDEIVPLDEIIPLEGVVELGRYERLDYRSNNGRLEWIRRGYADDRWRPNSWHRNLCYIEFWRWVDDRVAEIQRKELGEMPTKAKPKEETEPKQEDVDAAINYGILRHALDDIKHILKEERPSLEEVKEIARMALEDITEAAK